MTATATKRTRAKPPAPPTPPAPWEDFCDAVLSGVRPVGSLVLLAVQRHRRDLTEGAARGLRFDANSAQHAIDFFGFLRHSKGEWAGTPFVLADWQTFVIAMIFGWRRADGTRRFRDAYVEIPRKNGKSTLAAGVGLYLFFADGEQGAEVFTAATKRDQARIVHEEAVRMVKASPLLRSRIGSVRDNLHVKATNSKFEPLGADDDTMDGLNVHAAIVDEYHAHKNSGVFDKLNTATGARQQPLMFTITTAGANKAKSPCGQKNEYCQRVLLGTVEDDDTFAFIATIDEKDDWRDERVWAKANLNLGTSAKLDDLRRKARVAMEMPGAQNSFRRLHLNQWTEQSERWIDLEVWDSCAGEIEARELPEFLMGRVCYGALDLASTRDICALTLWFPPTDDETAGYLVPWLFVPNENILERDRKDRTTYSAWRDNEWLVATPGNITDYEFIRSTVHEVAERYQLEQVAYDRWNATQLVTQLTDDGIDMVPFGQGFASMAAPTKSFEAKVVGRTLAHGGHPVLRWMAQNVSIRLDPAGNMKPDKSTSGEKIDGIVAAIMAIGIAELQASDSTSSVYDHEDLKVL
jgi:phage terminase large subunit-like protein